MENTRYYGITVSSKRHLIINHPSSEVSGSAFDLLEKTEVMLSYGLILYNITELINSIHYVWLRYFRMFSPHGLIKKTLRNTGGAAFSYLPM